MWFPRAASRYQPPTQRFAGTQGTGSAVRGVIPVSGGFASEQASESSNFGVPSVVGMFSAPQATGGNRIWLAIRRRAFYDGQGQSSTVSGNIPPLEMAFGEPQGVANGWAPRADLTGKFAGPQQSIGRLTRTTPAKVRGFVDGQPSSSSFSGWLAPLTRAFGSPQGVSSGWAVNLAAIAKFAGSQGTASSVTRQIPFKVRRFVDIQPNTGTQRGVVPVSGAFSGSQATASGWSATAWRTFRVNAVQPTVGAVARTAAAKVRGFADLQATPSSYILQPAFVGMAVPGTQGSASSFTPIVTVYQGFDTQQGSATERLSTVPLDSQAFSSSQDVVAEMVGGIAPLTGAFSSSQDVTDSFAAMTFTTRSFADAQAQASTVVGSSSVAGTPDPFPGMNFTASAPPLAGPVPPLPFPGLRVSNERNVYGYVP